MKLSPLVVGGLAAILGLSLVAHPIRADEDVTVVASSSKSEVMTKQLGACGDDGYEYPNLYEEALSMVWLTRLVYSFSFILREARLPDNALTIPEDIEREFKHKRLDVRNFNEGNGLAFRQIYDQFDSQVDELKRIEAVGEYDLTVVERMKKVEDQTEDDTLFLEVFDALDEKVELVYGVFKDTLRKRIVIAIRGSDTDNDWGINLSAQMTPMKTPKLLRREELDGKYGNHTLVHRGFYEYIFDNTKNVGDKQKYDDILNDIKPFVSEGYKIYVTGHSLGGALSTLLAFKLAGSHKDWIPKPITVISVASPFVGGSGFKAGFEQLEKDGMLRHLRITNSRDIVPSLPPFSLGIRNKGLYQHTGIHLSMNNRNTFDISYAAGSSRLRRSLSNSLVKPVWSALLYHSISLHDDRLVFHNESLSNMTINGIYADESIVGSMAIIRDEL